MKTYKHSLSSYQLMTGDMGQLLPCGLTEVLPGDTFQHSTSALVRLSPMAAPVMHPAQVRLHHFFVPHRLSWDEATAGGSWEDFITGGPDGKNATLPPTIPTTGVKNDLLDYMGLPMVAGVEVNSMPIRAANLIFNEFYRDQDLVQEQPLNDTKIMPVSWEKDYFSTARPWAQKGDEVTLPIGSTANIAHNAADGANVSVYSDVNAGFYGLGASTANVTADSNAVGEVNKLYADLSTATATSVNDVRRAFAIQRFQEARAQYGSRYTEYLRYLGIKSSDGRQQRPEYLGGGTVNVSISEVLQTSPDEATPDRGEAYGVGDMYGHGIAAVRSNRYRRFFEEHGYVLSFISMRPKAVYSNGIQRHWLRQFKEDYFQKELQHIGQQEIWNDEVFAEVGQTGRSTWGYSDRYAEYKSNPSRATSEFRDILDFWHLARDFQALPGLNQTFVECVPSKRIFNVQTNHVLWMTINHSLVARRQVARDPKARII